MLVSPSTFYQKNLWAKKFNSRQLNNFQINIEPKLYQIPMFFRQGCIFPISLPDNQLLLLVTPGDGLSKLYMDKKKPEYFFINQQENKLKIIWKRGSYLWGIKYKTVIVKVISSEVEFIWQPINSFDQNKPLK